MKVKRFEDLTISETQKLIQCRDEKGDNLCRKGCKLHYPPFYCMKNMFLSNLFEVCKEKGLLTDKSGEWEIIIESEENE